MAAARAEGMRADRARGAGAAEAASSAASTVPIRSRTATSSIRAITPPRRPTAWGPWYAAAASLVLAAGLGAGWARERQVRIAERERSVRTLQELAERVRHRGALVDSARDSLLAAVTAPDVRMARLAVPGAPAAARLIWSPGQGVVLLTAAAMPMPRPGRTYQLWGIPRGGKPQSLGVFAPEPDGRVQAVMRVPPEAEMKVAAVTEEPEGGVGTADREDVDGGGDWGGVVSVPLYPCRRCRPVRGGRPVRGLC